MNYLVNRNPNDLKDALQAKAVSLLEDNPYILIEWATGVGKTLGAIKCLENSEEETCLIVVSETNHKKNWREDFKKHKKEYLLERVVFVCYSSLAKHCGKHYGLLILDECHRGVSDKRQEQLNKIICNKAILLSASLEAKYAKMYRKRFPTLQSLKYPIQTAINDGVLPIPKLITVEMELDEEKVNQIYVINRGIPQKREVHKCYFRDRWKFLCAGILDMTLEVYCTEKEKYDMINQNIEYLEIEVYQKGRADKKAFLDMAYIDRKRYLASIKRRGIIPVLTSIKHKRFICFCGSQEQANSLSKNVVHSDIKSKTNEETIDNFNNGVIDSLFVVNKLREGENLNNIEAGMVVQMDSAELNFIQKMGRVMRANSPELYILYFKDTSEVKYLSALNGINVEFIETKKLTEFMKK